MSDNIKKDNDAIIQRIKGVPANPPSIYSAIDPRNPFVSPTIPTANDNSSK